MEQNSADRKLLYEAILGGKDELFDTIAPVYYEWLKAAKVTTDPSRYLDDKDRLVDDFYRWLFQNGRMEVIAKIDRRRNPERRTDVRPEAPGRRQEDRDKVVHLNITPSPFQLPPKD